MFVCFLEKADATLTCASTEGKWESGSFSEVNALINLSQFAVSLGSSNGKKNSLPTRSK